MVRLSLLLAAALVATAVAGVCELPLQNRVDCGYTGITQEQCEQKGCCWNPSTQLGVPWCFHTTVDGYAVDSATKRSDGWDMTLRLMQAIPFFGPDITPLKVKVDTISSRVLRVRITDANKKRWEIPDEVLPTKSTTVPAANTDYSFEYTTAPFGFAVVRKSDGAVIWNTTSPSAGTQFNGLVYKDQYLELSTQLPTDANIFGLGERVHAFRLDTKGAVMTMWNRDAPCPVDLNIYGSHPFHMELRNGIPHGAFLKNSNGMDITLSPNALTYRVIGGIIDLYIFVGGGTPEQLTQDYHELIGRPYMPPMWSLGFHQCRWGYKNLPEVADVVANYEKAQIPLDTMWTDIDYMNEYEDFTFDPVNFPLQDVQAFVKKLHANKQRYVLIVDPGIRVKAGYPAWEEGLKHDIFIKKNGQPFIGKVWPGETAFPDFMHPGTQAYWHQQIADWLDTVPVDGLWIDMNEPSNFYNRFAPQQTPVVANQSSADRAFKIDYDNPPFAINNAGTKAPLRYSTLDMDALHYGGVPHYDAHNLYGHTETIATKKVLESYYKKRALVLSRSTFAGTGHHGAHWLGDNWSTWEHLQYSLPGIMSMNMLGIPFVGPDICGFEFDSNEELCVRWQAVGAFYPFARNHNAAGFKPQEPYRWESVANVTRVTLATRYSLVSYYNTLFYEVHKNGGTVARPLLFEFPKDPETLYLDQQMLIGSGLLISPVLKKGENSVYAYFPPAARWYDWWTRREFKASGWQTLSAPWNTIPVHIRGGSVLPLHLSPKLTIPATIAGPFGLLVALDHSAKATGSFFWDDGEQLDVHTDSLYTTFAVQNNQLTSSVAHNTLKAASPAVSSIQVLGVGARSISGVTVNGQAWPHFAYSAEAGQLFVSGLQLDTRKPFSVAWTAV